MILRERFLLTKMKDLSKNLSKVIIFFERFLRRKEIVDIRFDIFFEILYV